MKSVFKNKKAVSNVVVSLLLIFLAVLGISVIWISTNRILILNPQVQCTDFELKSNLEIKKVCYLNDGEVLVELKRGLDNFEIEKLKFVFDDAVFELKPGSVRCIDVRDFSGEYSEVCKIIFPGQAKKYVFDLSGEEKKNNFELGIFLKGNEKELCFGGEKKILDSC